MKKAFDKIKAFIDVWKIWLFFIALISTNGMQAGFHYSEPEKPIGKPAIAKPTEKPTIIKQIIYKPDNSYCDKKLNDHENGELH
ncbi:MAG: hypothetical protein KAR06_03710 [Deltaproteobacteria bacterium]|nr:hypothetical protein [Deltaproteobacteria bacterium]